MNRKVIAIIVVIVAGLVVLLSLPRARLGPDKLRGQWFLGGDVTPLVITYNPDGTMVGDYELASAKLRVTGTYKQNGNHLSLHFTNYVVQISSLAPQLKAQYDKAYINQDLDGELTWAHAEFAYFKVGTKEYSISTTTYTGQE